MAKANKTMDSITGDIQVKGELKGLRHGTGKFSKAEEYSIGFQPDEVEEVRTELAQYYAHYEGRAKTFIPEFVTGDKDIINLRSGFDIPLLMGTVETSVEKLIADYGTPKAGTRCTVIIKIKVNEDGKTALYPKAIRLPEESEIEFYSIANMFED